MKLQTAIAGALMCAYGVSAHAYDWNDWPVHYTFSDKTDFGATGNFNYDNNDYRDGNTFPGSSGLKDASATRREEFGFTLKKPGLYDSIVYYDFWNNQWLDVFARFQSKAFFGEDYGAFRFGYSKTYVGFEAVTSSRNDSFMETALPEQAYFEGRRTGVDWEFERPQYRIDLGAYGGQDLQGDNDGTTVNGRVAWTPFKEAGNVLHLGLSASEENPDSSVVDTGRGTTVFPSTRVRARPDAFLTATRLVDSGTIKNVDHIDRYGFESVWIHGPWSVQGEYLGEEVHRFDGKPNYSTSGGYIFGSWVLTGESRNYSGGNVSNIKPKGDWGAVELLLRYDELDLNDGDIHGGKQHNWTLGANWYILNHFRLMANYVYAHESGNANFNSGKSVDPSILLLRAQVYF